MGSPSFLRFGTFSTCPLKREAYYGGVSTASTNGQTGSKGDEMARAMMSNHDSDQRHHAEESMNDRAWFYAPRRLPACAYDEAERILAETEPSYDVMIGHHSTASPLMLGSSALAESLAAFVAEGAL